MRHKKSKYPYPVGWIAYVGILTFIVGYRKNITFMLDVGAILFLFSFFSILLRKGDKNHIGFDND